MQLILSHLSPKDTRSELRESNRSFRKYSVPEIIHKCQETYTFSPLGDSTGGIWLFGMVMGEVKGAQSSNSIDCFLKEYF
jgi:hypothetical protein